ncbi:formyltransferase [Noviherbaspirillum suwonense]|uniref:Methionyl-tRNA formyltransferase n=1 Tax=Noviherbaspirillum suwonense TaxID=1224511 RepID=A0ABY1QJY0_9BURK|nr:formyltransferase [Noviherbaspirillum suwonense]SMP70567.1 methionyl-tRNA formyltransferase [Noviherbaspirillum suwonense]
MKRAVVFAYHNVGVRCLKVLAARGIDVALVVTHHDNPAETIWFESVAALCDEMGIPWIAPDDPSTPELHAQVAAAQPDFIFSFYYRHMLPTAVLALAPRGAYNLHGSLLPRYRGRVPVNWAVLHGETETGATLHEMTAKPDAGAIIGQTMVPILPDDTAFEVFGKLTVASEQTLWLALPGLIAGTAPRLPNDLSQGSYFGGRKPEDGRIDWTRPAREIYNLHRAVAPPYPGAWTVVGGRTLVLGRARMAAGRFDGQPGLALRDGQLLGIGGDGQALRIIELLENGRPLGPEQVRGLPGLAGRDA